MIVSLPAPFRKKPVFALIPTVSRIERENPAGMTAYLHCICVSATVHRLASSGRFGAVADETIAVVPSPFTLTSRLPPMLADGPVFWNATVPPMVKERRRQF